ncbi:hypothetical protein GCM10023092_06270 [Rurimicrobium arvi]|uniref:Uncharacterized protein n=1 Tax=Rurimicrobium arvi TaxID=2049916 RepID=A0ABP8MKT9_9BACT
MNTNNAKIQIGYITYEADTSAENATLAGAIYENCGVFLNDYSGSLKFDSTIKFNTKVFQIKLSVDKTDSFTIPDTLLFGCKKQLVFGTLISIFQKDTLNKSIVLDRHSLAKYVSVDSRNLTELGVPIEVSIAKINSQMGLLYLHLSYSIPYTDLGEGLLIKVDLKNMSIAESNGDILN